MTAILIYTRTHANLEDVASKIRIQNKSIGTRKEQKHWKDFIVTLSEFSKATEFI